MMKPLNTLIVLVLITFFGLVACGGGGGSTDTTATITTTTTTTTTTHTPQIVDSTAPVITLFGDNPLTLAFGTLYAEAGATALDETDGPLGVRISGQVNSFIAANYTVHYSASDATGNTATITRTVIVEPEPDTTAPSLNMLGDASMTVDQHMLYTDPGVTANDNIDGELVVTTIGVVNTAVLGTYTLQYQTSDQAGNSSTVTRNVEVVAAPHIKYVAIDGNDTNAGTLESPWRHIQFAVNRLSPGDTLIIQAGNYQEKVVLSRQNSGTAEAPITIRGLYGAILDGTGLTPNGREGLLSLNNASYVTIENLEIAYFKTAPGFYKDDYPIGILIEGASHHLSFKNNYIHEIQNLSSCSRQNNCYPAANGIAVYGNTSTAISDLLFVGNEVAYCMLGSSEAFTLNGNVDGFQLIANNVHDNNNIGFDFIGYEDNICTNCSEEQNRARNGIVKANRAVNNSIHVPLAGFDENPWNISSAGNAAGFYVDGGRNIVFAGNIASQNDLGFEFASEHAGKASEEILMVNNYVYLNREVGLTLGGYSASALSAGGGHAKNIHIYNNSFYKNKGWGTEVVLQYRIDNVFLDNNIIFGAGSLPENYYAVNNGQHNNITWGNNIWWANEVNTVSLFGNAIIENPLYLNPEKGQLNLTEHSPAREQALIKENISHWTEDFWQDVLANGVLAVHDEDDIHAENRFYNTLDLGADEYQPDTTAPIVTLIGDNPTRLVQNTAYTELGATAVDAREGAVMVMISGSVDSSQVGTYRIRYSASDAMGNTATVERSINVVAESTL